MYPYAMLLAGLGLFGLSAFAWLQRHRPSVRAFALFMASIAVWVLCIAAWSLSGSPERSLLWFRLQFLGVASAPVSLLNYTLQFTGRGGLLGRRSSRLLWAVPLLTILIALSPAFGWLLFTRVDFASEHGYIVLKSWEAAPWFILHSTYSFGLVALSVAIMGRAALRSGGIFRNQMIMLLLAIVPPVIAAALNTFQILPSDVLVMPIGFALTGAAIVWSILRNQMISVAPVARELLVEQMEDGMLVVDEGGRVVDLNSAMQALVGRPRGALLGLPLEQALAELPALRAAIERAPAGHAEVELSGAQHYDIQLSELLVDRRPAGRLVVLRNISRLKHVQSELFALATTDPLTGLSNRRQFFELARSRAELSARRSSSLALLLFDIDTFKRINDQHGHGVGDQVLVEVAWRAASIVRGSDLLCRYGGEEFVALLSDTEGAAACAVAERLRSAVAEAPVEVTGASVSATISVGVAVGVPDTPAELLELLRQADQAMYQAKRDGRNCVRMLAP